MEEKTLVVSQRCKIGIGLMIFALLVAIVAFSIQIVPRYIDMQFCEKSTAVETSYNAETLVFDTVFAYCGDDFRCDMHEGYSSAFDYAFGSSEALWIWIGISAGVAIVCLNLYALLRDYEMTVTNKRIYGETALGKRVDLPVDSVCAIGPKWPKGVEVSTSSGRISFLMFKNHDEIHKCVSNLLIERQAQKTANAPTSVMKQEIPQSNADELKKYKELLDMGAITQEEFDAKKKQLLGL